MSRWTSAFRLKKHAKAWTPTTRRLAASLLLLIVILIVIAATIAIRESSKITIRKLVGRSNY